MLLLSVTKQSKFLLCVWCTQRKLPAFLWHFFNITIVRYLAACYTQWQFKWKKKILKISMIILLKKITMHDIVYIFVRICGRPIRILLDSRFRPLFSFNSIQDNTKRCVFHCEQTSLFCCGMILWGFIVTSKISVYRHTHMATVHTTATTNSIGLASARKKNDNSSFGRTHSKARNNFLLWGAFLITSDIIWGATS